MKRNHVTALAIALAVLAALLSGCASQIPREKLACFVIEEYRHCIVNISEYGLREQFNAAYCKRAAMDEAAKPYVRNWSGGYLRGCEQ